MKNVPKQKKIYIPTYPSNSTNQMSRQETTLVKYNYKA